MFTGMKKSILNKYEKTKQFDNTVKIRFIYF